MRVAVTGTRTMNARVENSIRLVIPLIACDDAVEEMRFGGAIGSDTLALKVAGDYLRTIGKSTDLSVFLPWAVASQPIEAQEVIEEYATIIVENCGLGKEHPWRARNEAMILGIHDKPRVDSLVAFWEGNKVRSGTYMTINIARSNGIYIYDAVTGLSIR